VGKEDTSIKTSEISGTLNDLPDLVWRDTTLSGAKLQDHVKVLKELRVKRDIAEKIKNGEDMEKVVREIEKLNQQGLDKFLKPRELALELYSVLEAKKAGKRGTPYPFPMLNKATGGIQDGQFVIVAARPSVGKSAFLSNVAVKAGKLGKKVLFASAEMSNEAVGMRIISQLTGKNFFYEDISISLEELIKMLELTNIFVHQFTSINELEAKIREYERKIDLVLVDYLQVIEPKNRYGSTFEKTSFVVSELVQIKNKYNLPIVAASQYNRVAARAQPTMADLYESGKIEQAADVIISLWDSGEIDLNDKKRIKIDLLKNRNGFTFGNSSKSEVEYALWFNKKKFEFYEEERSNPPF